MMFAYCFTLMQHQPILHKCPFQNLEILKIVLFTFFSFNVVLFFLLPYLSFFLVQFVPFLHFLLPLSSSLFPFLSVITFSTFISHFLSSSVFSYYIASLYTSFSFPFHLYSCAIITFSSSLCFCSLLYFYISSLSIL
jgi:hypothetical protein